MRSQSTVSLLAATVLFFSVILLRAQPSSLLKQTNERSTPVPMTDEELADLGDPFASLVFKATPQPVTLTALESIIQPNQKQRATFVVSEEIASDTHGQRRMVLTFDGSNGTTPLVGNVMLSVFFDASGFSEDSSAVEALGWDDARGRYNYYKLDVSPAINRRVWTFRGSSQGASRLTAAQRSGTCFACHLNGAPIMRELLFPWANWNSFAFRAPYLTPTGPRAWSVSNHARLAKELAGAETLESTIQSSITRFNRHRVGAAVNRDNPAEPILLRPREALRSLFATTEFNILSSPAESGMHPFAGIQLGRPSGSVRIPASFFVNADILSELGIPDAGSFGDVAQLSPSEYATLVTQTHTTLDGRTGDALFAWLTPEPSHVDTDYVLQLLRGQTLPRHLAAAALSVDCESSFLSARRAELLQFIPESATPVNSLVRVTRDALGAARPTEGSAAADFLMALNSPDPNAFLAERIRVYATRLRTSLSDPTTRNTELARLYQQLVTRRRDVLAHAQLRVLDETNGALFPRSR